MLCDDTEWLSYVKNCCIFIHLILHCNLQHLVIRVAPVNRKFLKNWTGAQNKDVSRETQMYGDPTNKQSSIFDNCDSSPGLSDIYSNTITKWHYKYKINNTGSHPCGTVLHSGFSEMAVQQTGTITMQDKLLFL